jgi:PAS domain S-box-containing protein
MTFSLSQILFFIVVYLTGLFAVAHLADRGVIPERVTRHPATYVLSLGVFAGAMATNGVIAMAHRYGYSFLLYYIGVAAMFVMATVFLLPLLRLCRVYQLASLADVLSFRFRSGGVGASITLAMCVTLLPLLALQIQAVSDSIHILEGHAGELSEWGHEHDVLPALFCVIITVFSMLFGTRHPSSQDRNTGLVTAIAFESLVKLAALWVLMLAAVFQVFGGFGGLEQWLVENPGLHRALESPAGGNTARTLLLLFFAGAVCMPHIFHMAFAENNNSEDLRRATWGLPLYLLLISLPILPVTWAGVRLEHSVPMDYTGLALGASMQSTLVSAAAFVAGLSAASATIIVTTLALANMCINHLVLPSSLLSIDRDQGVYIQLKWLRRAFIILLILAGYAFFIRLEGEHSLTQLALVAFTGTLQFLPGVIATPYWPDANRRGLLAGLLAGLLVWCLGLLLPSITGYRSAAIAEIHSYLFGPEVGLWVTVSMASLALNTALFVAVSLLSRSSQDEKVAAEICSMDDLARPTRQTLAVHSAGEFVQQLTPALGERTAEAEVQRALRELQFGDSESRPYALRRLRGRLEANLSGLLGPAVAHGIIERCVPFQPGEQEGIEDIHLIERNLDRGNFRLTGLAADLDKLRRRHRETLDRLPIGICSVAADGEILMWNRSMREITGIAPAEVVGSLIEFLPQPWQRIIGDFLEGEEDTVLKSEVRDDEGGSRWISLLRTVTRDELQGNHPDRVILVEDITELERLEEELLHNERLASIGRLAAGVAHEIGNPVTGIACLAQNLAFETDAAEINSMAGEILKQTDRVTRIVESLVNFSHTGSGSDDLRLAPSNLADCVDEAIHLLSLDQQAKPVLFSNLCDRELVVLADSQRLLQVFINLLGNARDACEPGGQVRVSAVNAAGQIAIAVEDDGCGIAPELQSRVFEPFFTTKEPGAGTGLGLALAYSIMEDMGGSIDLDSPTDTTAQAGTRITLHLPQSDYGSSFKV